MKRSERQKNSGGRCLRGGWLLAVVCTLFTSCIHKELCYDHSACRSLEVEFLFDWSRSAGADPSEMNLFLFPEEGGEPIFHQFTSKHGGKRLIPYGKYKVIAFNNNDNAHRDISGDNLSGISTRGMNSFHTFETYLRQERNHLASYANAARAVRGSDEQVVRPGRQLWSASLQGIEIIDDGTPQRVVLYPEQRHVTYTIVVEEVDNPYVATGDGVRFEASLSGMLSGLLLGEVTPTTADLSTIAFPVTKPNGTLHAEVITLGEDRARGNDQEHTLTIYYILPDGRKLYEDFKFKHTDAIVDASDPYNIIVTIPKLSLPKPLVVGTDHITINSWQEAEHKIEVKM